MRGRVFPLMPRRAKTHSDFAGAVDRQLERYRSMRDFHVTAEPEGSSGGRSMTDSGTLPFVIQKHAATRLHYDFRLGWRGVLRSWAVTKGPSYVPADKRLAVEVEDHPIEYGGFEGSIPKGQYGGGTVMIWDQGTWEPVEDVDEGFRKGSLKFVLHGSKMHGQWALIRMKGDRYGRSDGKPNWLLIKDRDDYSRGPGDPAITEEAPNSAITGRSIEQIAADEDHIWNSNRPERPKSPPNRSRLTALKERLAARQPESQARSVPPDRESALRDAPREKMPGFIAPELAASVDHPPDRKSTRLNSSHPSISYA